MLPLLWVTPGSSLLCRLAAIALLVLEDEESAFWCLVAIVETILPAEYYSKTLTASQVSRRVVRGSPANPRGVPSGQQMLGLCLSYTVAFEPSLTARDSLVLRACKIVRSCSLQVSPVVTSYHQEELLPGEGREKSMSLAISQSRTEKDHGMVGWAVG